MHRDKKGRFCRLPDTETPDLLPKVGDIGFHAECRWLEAENKVLPQHYTVGVYTVEEITSGGEPICYPWSISPDEALYLEDFDTAKEKAIDETTQLQLIFNKDLAEYQHMLAGNPKYEKLAFKRPKDFEAPKYVVGQEAYGIVVHYLCGLQVRACRGVIIGMQLEYEDDTRNGGLYPGWNYQVYYQEEATEKDRYYGDKPGDIKEKYEWVHESNIYTDQKEAIQVFLAQARRINTDYAQILSGLHNLKVEDVEPPKK